MQERQEKVQRDVMELKLQLKQQQEYCTSHHIYDASRPLLSADMILQSPGSEADCAALGLLDLVQQVWGFACGCRFNSRAWMTAYFPPSDTAKHLWNDADCGE